MFDTMRTITPVFLLSVCLGVSACDAPAAEVEVKTEPSAQADVAAPAEAGGAAEVKTPEGPTAVAAAATTIKPEMLDLETVSYLIKKGKIKDAKSLEAKINSPKERLSTVDVDGDGKVDKIVIVEVKQGDGAIVFELQAVPSTSKKKDEAVVVAVVTFAPDRATNVLVVKATYAPVVIGYEAIVYDYTVPIVVKNDVVVVEGGGGFYGWLYAPSRPVYYGVFVYESPPPPVFVIEVGHDHGCWPPGHCKHGKWKGKGKHWKGGKHGKHGKRGKWH